ncbi:MAG: Uma2 family endonuclease [Planctomycetaceae bacterium]
MSTVLKPYKIIYPDSDGKPMAETDIHIDQMTDLYFALDWHFRDDPNVYLARNMLFYFVEGDPKKRISPDVFFVRGVPKKKRRTYLLWDEGIAPQVVFEITSRSTKREDMFKKPSIYGQIGVQEYYLFDPTEEYLKGGTFVAYHWQDGEFVRQEMTSNRIYSPNLELDLVVHEGWLRVFDPHTLTLLRTPAEEADDRERAEAERERAEADRERALAARRDAEAACERAKLAQRDEAQARQQAESELIRLRQELDALKHAAQSRQNP